MCILSGQNQNVTKEYVLELLKYNNKRELFEELQIWSPPRFPVSGTMLQSHDSLKGRKMGRLINKLKEMWAKSDFQMTSDDLMKEVPSVLKELNESSDGKVVMKKPKINWYDEILNNWKCMLGENKTYCCLTEFKIFNNSEVRDRY